MVAKTRRGARKGRSTRRATRAAKRGGFFGICSSRAGNKTEAQIIKEVKARLWHVNEATKVATCYYKPDNSKINDEIFTQTIEKVVKNSRSYWEYPSTTCNGGLDRSVVQSRGYAPAAC